MIVAFLNDQAIGVTLEPPKNPHITIKKKFKLINTDEQGLIKLFENDEVIRAAKKVETGTGEEYGSTENMIIPVKNASDWQDLHEHLLNLLAPISESRDPHFEGMNYLPHITWRLKGEDNLDPGLLANRKFVIENIYLIERIHPTKSIARIITKVPLKQ